MDARLIDEK
jgi:oxalate decarboxylase/phosphoglucose isomerase-like protein (cupin superfamily)